MKSDREIIQAFEVPESRELAFSHLVSKYQERLYWHCRRLLISHEDADDALQNTFIKVWTKLDNFRSESSLYTWLFRIATNESLTLLRSNKKHPKEGASDGEYENRLADQIEADPYFDGDDAQLKLQKAILSLPEKQRLVFNMKYYEEMKYKDMAEVLETSEGALKASYHHAVKKIESFVKGE